MGIDYIIADRLLKLVPTLERKQDFLMLGRQGLHIRPRFEDAFGRLLAAHDPDWTPDDVIAEDGFSERFLHKLGFANVEAMDASGYEGAGFVHDLNLPVSGDYSERFDFILDGGTIEHVFNAPQALTNVFNMLRPGGVFVSVNGGNGWFGHGFYQFSPELPWSFWHHTCGCEMLECLALPDRPRNKPIKLPDPRAEGRRTQPALPPGRVYLYYAVQKPDGAAMAAEVAQSDYSRRWTRAER